ncbi:hypothetical protein [Fimbriiglobus ruber]|uniref:hypothetical protein n=1 Tax=Fimbriiglobus ruber TaxID=1908690 RepID=UPI000B4BAB18|nr:hypothetical protein [Fimbriiglobus ruber]
MSGDTPGTETDVTCPQCDKQFIWVVPSPPPVPESGPWQLRKSGDVWVVCPKCKYTFPGNLPLEINKGIKWPQPKLTDNPGEQS